MKLFPGISVLSSVKSDEEWMVRLKANQREAFDALYEKYKRPIMSYIYSMTRDQNLSEDLTQETFLKLYRTRESYVASAKFSTFLWTIAKHTTFDHLAKKKELLHAQSDAFGEPLESKDESPGADELMIREIEESKVRECLERLSPRAKHIVALRIFSEETYSEISKITSETEGTVKTILHRSKASLVECFKRRSK
ncbi:RNA polymerase sigma factor [bacterium]|nr:RNA polymerase sigma factor [bacterium]